MKQNEIWLINLDPTIGAEIRKTRPAIIVNDNALGRLPLKIIVPVTDWKEKYKIAPWMVKIEPDYDNGLQKTSSADCFQVRSISQQRFIRKLGTISETEWAKSGLVYPRFYLYRQLLNSNYHSCQIISLFVIKVSG